MTDTVIAKQPPHVRVAQGGCRRRARDAPRHGALPRRRARRARESAIAPALARTQQQVANIGGTAMGMNWILSTLNGRTIIAHGGGTGGYSSYVGFDRDAKRAVVLLSDTVLTSLGGLGTLGRHLLDPSVPVGRPRIVATADDKLIDALVGRYRLQSGLGMDLRHTGNTLTIQADAQPEFEMGYDSAGDFYPLKFDALLRPKRKVDGTYTFTWFQGGGVQEAERIDARAPVASKWTPTQAQLREYEGNYSLAPTFALRVFATGAKLFIQGTNQGPLEVAAVQQDVFVAESVGAEIDFERDASSKVIALTLKQGGQVLRGERH